MLVEDEPVNQVVARRLLENEGHNVEVVENGREALQTLKETAFDLILMDIQMPDMDGLETTRRIRLSENKTGGRKTPIVGLTANAMSEDRARGLSAGMDDYITKPIQIDVLKRVIEKVSTRTS